MGFPLELAGAVRQAGLAAASRHACRLWLALGDHCDAKVNVGWRTSFRLPDSLNGAYPFLADCLKVELRLSRLHASICMAQLPKSGWYSSLAASIGIERHGVEG
jgi:hypothetical protein